MNSEEHRLTCEETFARLDDYLDRELSAEELKEVEAHIAMCGRCAPLFRFEASALDSIKGKLRRIAMPAGLLDQILGRLKAP